MLFSSNIFIWYFLPIVIILYYAIDFFKLEEKLKLKIKNCFLLIASLIFYSFGEPVYIALLLFSIVFNYYAGELINVNKENEKTKNIILIVTIVGNILLLFYFKYFNMFLSIVEGIIDGNFQNIISAKRSYSIGIADVILPIGISFYTFQAISYIVDLYYQKIDCQKSIINFALYISFFPQLIAGPIVKYRDINYALENRLLYYSRIYDGIKRFVYGLAKKVLLANTFAEVVDSIWELELQNLGMVLAILSAVLYTFQIYYDFSGYSDMAIGLGKIFGFDFNENFNYPYISRSITEFWRRWHISLSTWFKEYVYIPLGGNRNGEFDTYKNLLIVFLLTGIWHGANLTFLFWGFLYGVVLILEKKSHILIVNSRKFGFIFNIYVLIVVILLFILFRADSLNDAIVYYRQFGNLKSDYSIFAFLNMKLILFTIIGLFLVGYHKLLFNNLLEKYRSNIVFIIGEFVLVISLFILSTISLADSTYNPFIYFRF